MGIEEKDIEVREPDLDTETKLQLILKEAVLIRTQDDQTFPGRIVYGTPSNVGKNAYTAYDPNETPQNNEVGYHIYNEKNGTFTRFPIEDIATIDDSHTGENAYVEVRFKKDSNFTFH